MKKIYTFLFSISFTVSGIAQSIISNVEPAIGDHFHNTIAVYDNVEVGESGANVYWDFTELPDQTQHDYNYTVLDPSEVEGSEDFPAATSVWFLESSLGGTSNSFLNFDNDEMKWTGFLSENLGRDRYYDDPQLNFTFPLSYQDSGTDTYSGHFLNPFNVEIPFSGVITYVVDGYGELMLQDSLNMISYYALRVSTIIEEVETNEFGDTVLTYGSTTAWYSTLYPVPLQTVSSSYYIMFDNGSVDTTFSDTTFVIESLVSYDGSVGLMEPKPDRTFTIYPNPTSEAIVINTEIQGRVKLKVFSTDGKMVLNRDVQSHEQIDVSSLESGYYVAVLVNDGVRLKPSSFVVH